MAVTAAVLFGTASCAASREATAEIPPLYSVSAAMTEEVGKWENTRFCLTVDRQSGEFSVRDKENDTIWYSNPLNRTEDSIAAGKFKMNMYSALAIRYADPEAGSVSSSNSYTASVRKNGLTVFGLEKGFKAVYRFPSEGITIPLYVTLTDEGIRCEIPLQEISETDKYKLYTIELLPFMGAASLAEEGYLFVPDGSGALIRFQNQKQDYNSYEQKLYGKDRAHDMTQDKIKGESARLPVFGISRQNSGLLGIISSGDGRADILANVAGKYTSYHTVYPSFSIRGIDTYAMGESSGINVKVVNIFEEKALPNEVLSVEYLPLSEKSKDYVGMATAYRDYLMKYKGLQKSNTASAAIHLELLGGFLKKQSVLGIPMEKTVPVTTYQQAKDILEELTTAGTKNLRLLYTGWSVDSINETPQVRAKYSAALGKKSDLTALTETAKAQNIPLYLSVDLSRTRSWKNGLHRYSDAAKGISQNAAVQYYYDKATFFKLSTVAPLYLIAPRKQEQMMKDFLTASAKWNASGVLLDTAGDLLYSDYDEESGTDRQQNSLLAAELVTLCRDASRQVMVRGGNAYAMPAATAATDIPTQSSGYDSVDEAVPFYSIVFHGCTELSGSAVNLSGNPKEQLLKAAEAGTALHFRLGQENTEKLSGTKYDGLYSLRYTDWKETLTEYAAQLTPLLEATAGSFIIGHTVLENGLTETTYDNGVTVWVNYQSHAVTQNGMTIEAESFRFVGR